MAECIKIIVLETIVHDLCKCKGIVILHLFIVFYYFIGLFATCPLHDSAWEQVYDVSKSISWTKFY